MNRQGKTQKSFLRALRAFAVKKKIFKCLNRQDAKAAKGKTQKKSFSSRTSRLCGEKKRVMNDFEPQRR